MASLYQNEDSPGRGNGYIRHVIGTFFYDEVHCMKVNSLDKLQKQPVHYTTTTTNKNLIDILNLNTVGLQISKNAIRGREK